MHWQSWQSGRRKRIMTAKSYRRGWPVVSYDDKWIYADTGKSAEIERSCVRCGKMPTPEGHDACLGTIPGVVFACCGHGVEKPYTIYKNKSKNKSNLPWYIKTGKRYVKDKQYIVEIRVSKLTVPYILLINCFFHPLRVIKFLIT